MHKVVLTGLGLVTPMGASLAELRGAFERGRSVVRALPDSSTGRARAAAIVDEELTGGLSPTQLKLLDRTGLMALRASDRAMADAGLVPGSFDSARIGVFLGCGAGSTHANNKTHEDFFVRDKMGPFDLLRILPNHAASHVAMRHGLHGECATVAVACTSASIAMGTALRQIRHGYLDMALVGGTDAPMGESTYRAWESMRILARVDPERPHEASRPFAKGRTGIVLGEGAAMYVLESEASARARGARILATLAGYGASADASHITLPDSPGQVAAMRAAAADAGLSLDDIGYINAHATATVQGDAIEARSVREAFAARAGGPPPISATTAMHGHLLGASGAVETAFCLLALNEGFLTPTLNVDAPDPECDLDIIPNQARTGVAVQAVMNNCFGFGGSNASLIFTKP